MPSAAVLNSNSRTHDGMPTSSARRLISRPRPGYDSPWHALRLSGLDAGPVRLEFSTKPAGPDAVHDVCTVWGSPRIEWPRSLNNLFSTIRSTCVGNSLRWLWSAWRRRSALPTLGARAAAIAASPAGSAEEALGSLGSPGSQGSPGSEVTRFTGFTGFIGFIRFVGRSLWLRSWRSRPWCPGRTAKSVLGQSYPAWEWILLASGESTLSSNGSPLGSAGIKACGC